MSKQQLVFEDVTDQWEISSDFSYDDSAIFAWEKIALVRLPNGTIDLIGDVSGDCIYTEYGDVVATRKPKKPPEPKYVPFENAEEARAVVGWEPWVKRKEESDVRRKIDFWNKTGAFSYIWDELCESLLWSNTPDDDKSWKPFGKLVTE